MSDSSDGMRARDNDLSKRGRLDIVKYGLGDNGGFVVRAVIDGKINNGGFRGIGREEAEARAAIR